MWDVGSIDVGCGRAAGMGHGERGGGGSLEEQKGRGRAKSAGTMHDVGCTKKDGAGMAA